MKHLIIFISLLVSTNIIQAQFGSQQIISDSADGSQSVFAADIDGDGNLDILSASINDNKIAWYKNDGIGSFGPQQIITTSAYDAKSVYATDLDGDGDVDVLSASWQDNKIAWYKNDGTGNFGLQLVISTNAISASSVYATDLDGDGFTDVLSASINDNKIAWYKNDGIGNFGPQLVITTNADNARSVYAADLDGDGFTDVLSASLDDDKIAWYKNDGSGNFGPQLFITVSTDGATSVYAADLDGDGDKDVISASSYDDKIAWYKNDGSGNFGPQQPISTLTNTPYSVYAEDLDGDGNIDVISASFIDNKIAWYKNDGSGNFGSQQIITTSAQSACSVYAADMDGDGDNDVISGSFGDDKIALYENYYRSNYVYKGVLFYDSNQNASRDSNELGLNLIQTQLQPNGLASYTNNDGEYYFAVDTGTHTVSFVPTPSWSLSTDSIYFTRTISDSIPVIDSLNFGFYPDTIETIIHPEITGGFPRCNQTTLYWLNISNLGSTLPSGIIHLKLDDDITYTSAEVTPDSIVGQNLYWHYDSLFYFSEELIKLQVQLPPFSSMGDTLSSILTIKEIDSNINVVYTTADTLNQILLCAYDPNDKSVTPLGLGIEGYIANNQKLEYLIRFQNTGNDTAITINIRDQLDDNLNWNTLRPIASSHAMQLWVEQDGEAIFKFENIMLPDSNVDELASHGFVKFSISPKPNLLPNTTIFNTGHIYFDLNPAVITNTTLNTIECYLTPMPIISFNWPYLDAGVSGNYSYQWYLNDTIISNATSNIFLPLANGDYTVSVLDTNNCPKTSELFNFFSVGIKELNQLKIIVYPNPFSESTTILFDKTLNENYDLLIYNIVGTEVKRINKIAGNKVEISKNEIGKGLFFTYLINTKTKEKIFIEKLIVL